LKRAVASARAGGLRRAVFFRVAFEGIAVGMAN
jgi:hypothetical protein